MVTKNLHVAEPVTIGNPVKDRNSTRCCKLSNIFLPNPHATVGEYKNQWEGAGRKGVSQKTCHSQYYIQKLSG